MAGDTCGDVPPVECEQAYYAEQPSRSHPIRHNSPSTELNPGRSNDDLAVQFSKLVSLSDGGPTRLGSRSARGLGCATHITMATTARAAGGRWPPRQLSASTSWPTNDCNARCRRSTSTHDCMSGVRGPGLLCPTGERRCGLVRRIGMAMAETHVHGQLSDRVRQVDSRSAVPSVGVAVAARIASSRTEHLPRKPPIVDSRMPGM